MFGFGPADSIELWHSECRSKPETSSSLLFSVKIFPAEALRVGRSRGHFWLSTGLSFYILILTSQLVSQYYHATEDTVKVTSFYLYLYLYLYFRTS